MSDLLATLEAQTGLGPDLVKNAFGAVVSFLKDHLPADLFGRVESAVPQAGDSLSSFLSNQQGGGLLEAAGKLIGKLTGGQLGDLPKLLEKLSHAGLSLDQAREFLPRAVEALKKFLPADLMQEILKHLPALGEATGQPA
jgi:hypothetical protein